nr:MAG: RNA-dependent RNA polymerase [Fushun hierodula formosana phenuivirus 1]
MAQNQELPDLDDLLLLLHNGVMRFEDVLVTSEAGLIHETRTLPFPEPEVDYDPIKGITRIDLPEEIPIGSATSITRSVRERNGRTSEEMRSFIHDFTFGIFTAETDVRLDKIFPRMNDGFDNLTPDAFSKMDNLVGIFEFATSRAPMNLRRVYETKKDKYSVPISSRVTAMAQSKPGNHYYLIPIVVSPNRIAAPRNINWPMDLCNELCARMRFAMNVVSKACAQGLNLQDTQHDQVIADIGAMIKVLRPDFSTETQPGSMTEEVIDTSDLTAETTSRYSNLLYRAALEDGLNKILSGPQSEKDASRAIGSWMSEMSTGRTDQKAVIQLPGVLPGLANKKLTEFSFSNSRHWMSDTWDSVIHAINCDPSIIEEKPLEEEIEIAEQEDTEDAINLQKEARRDYHRIKPHLKDATILELAKVGVEGKHLRDDGEVSTYRRMKKEPFSINVPTNDIDEFLEDCYMPPPHSEQLELSTRLILSSMDQWRDPNINFFKTLFKEWRNCPIYQWLDMITDIGTELSISLKQNVSKGELVIKKLRRYDMWMLIKPTKASEHVFVSFLWVGDDQVRILPEGISKHYLRMGEYCCTEFVSFNKSKLVNLVKAGPLSVGLIAQWVRHFEVTDLLTKQGYTLKKACDAYPEVLKMFWITILMHLEDKHRTEEAFTAFRFISMEKFNKVTHNRTKMLDKLPSIIRSRLQAWVMKKLIGSMMSDLYSWKHDCNGREEGGRWLNLINPYFPYTYDHPRKLVELYYIGYSKNKDEESNRNTEFELVRKIIKYENKLFEADAEKLGPTAIKIVGKMPEDHPSVIEMANLGVYTQKDQGRNLLLEDSSFHEFSRPAVCAAADNFRSFMRRQFGDSWTEELKNQVFSRWARITWEDIGTLKASSLYDPSTGKIIKKGEVKSSRAKVISVLLNNDKYMSKAPWQVLPEVIKWVDNDGGLRIDIFRKNQHGGLREIYVMDLRSRIIQLFMEELAKAACSYLPSETMLHPNNKISRPQEHVVKGARAPQRLKATCNSSNDAMVWSQGHHVNKFAQFLCRVFPTDFHGFIHTVLKQWRTKRIALPDGLLTLLNNRPDTLIYDETDKMLADAYTGRREQPWLKAGKHHLVIQSGMMQGILHYVSSFMHACVLLLRDEQFKLIVKKMEFKTITTDLVSSDDSSRLTTILADDEKDYKKGLLWSRADHLAITMFSRAFGIFMSVKSTMCTENLVEFNSEFFFRASLARPTIKWALAAYNVTEVESLYERQEVLYNLMAQLLEGGGGFFQAYMTQIGQAILHYKLMGSAVNRLFGCFQGALIETTDPSLGYFIMDNARTCGVYGLGCCFYNLVVNSRKLRYRLKDQLEEGDFTTTTTGSLTSNIQLRFGNRKKAMSILEEGTASLPDWKERLNNQPGVLYRRAKDHDERVMKLLIKLASPSVSTSLSSGNQITKMIAASVYMVSRQCNTIGSAWMYTMGILKSGRSGNKTSRKVSLWRAVRSVPPTVDLTDDDMEVLFPKRDQYRIARETTDNINRLIPQLTETRKCLRSHISVFSEVLTLPFNLETMVRWKWFGDHPPSSDSHLQRIWLRYCARIKWLKDTLEDTFEASPYEDHIQLRNFLARVGTKGRVIHLTGVPLKTAETRDMVVMAALANQFPGISLSRSESTLKAIKSTELESLQHEIACVMGYPFHDERKLSEINKLLISTKLIWKGDERRFGYRATSLSLLQAFAQLENKGFKEESCDEFLALLRSSRQGVIGSFTQPQTQSGSKWVGEGKWCGVVGDCFITLELLDNKVIKIICNSIQKLRDNLPLLKLLIREMNSEVTNEPSILDTKFHLAPSGLTYEDRGTPVFEIDNLQHVTFLEPRDMWTVIRDDLLSLRVRVSNREVTICKYRPVNSDFRFHLAKPRNTGGVYEKWRTNAGLQKGSGEKALLSIARGNVSSALDIDRVKDFFGALILGAFHSQGWVLREEDLMKLTDFNSSGSDLEDFDFDNFVAMGGEVFLEDGNATDLVSEFTDHDIVMALEDDKFLNIEEMVDFKYVETKRVVSDVKKSHNLLRPMVAGWYSNFSSKERSLFMSKKALPKMSELIEITSFFLGWEFTEYREEEGVDEDIYDVLSDSS